MLFLGDSITFGAGTSCPEKRYTSVFEKNTGAEVYNYGINGTRIARQINPLPENYHDANDFISRVEKMNDAADYVVVFGGTNDYKHGDAPFGTFDDRGAYTFYGALHTLIISIVNRYPEARIIFMTPLHRTNESCTTNIHGMTTPPFKAYVDAIRAVCEFYSIPVLDLYKNSGMNPEIPIIRELYMPDGLHPSDKGAERIAQMLETFLNNL